jgi:hypothetical protein
MLLGKMLRGLTDAHAQDRLANSLADASFPSR